VIAGRAADATAVSLSVDVPAITRSGSRSVINLVTGSRVTTSRSIDQAGPPVADGPGMALSQVGNAAGEAALDAGMPRQREPFVPRPTNADDPLLEAIRRGLVPRDPVARLLALWPPPPARAVEVVSRRRGGLLPGPA